MDYQVLGVIGAGTMGGGIAHQMALSGYRVVLCDVQQSLVDKAIARMDSLMEKQIAKGKMTAGQKTETLQRITATANLEDLSQCQFIVEAVFENLEVKKDLFHRLDQLLPADVILATNTSSMSITVIAETTNRQDRVVGMHFFNPPQVMKLVEVVRGYKTSDHTVAQTMELARKLGKEPIEVKRDSPGFIVNRVMIPQFIEAIRIVEEGIASPEDVDKAVKLGLNYPMGPFELQDFAGVEIGLHVMDYFYDEFRDDRFAAPMLLRQLVRAGRLGKKSGAGWYNYNDK